jgi:DNA processing protein
MNKLIHPNSVDPLMTIGCLSQDSIDYPKRLLDLCDPPKKLFYIGNAGLLNQPMVAIVGARKASHTGLLHADHFAAGLGRSGYHIVSGLAYGIDSAAHRSVLALGGQAKLLRFVETAWIVFIQARIGT